MMILQKRRSFFERLPVSAFSTFIFAGDRYGIAALSKYFCHATTLPNYRALGRFWRLCAVLDGEGLALKAT